MDEVNPSVKEELSEINEVNPFSKRSFEGWTKSILFQSGAFHDGRSQSFFKEELSEFNEVNP
jgi:hypothetical protein